MPPIILAVVVVCSAIGTLCAQEARAHRSRPARARHRAVRRSLGWWAGVFTYFSTDFTPAGERHWRHARLAWGVALAVALAWWLVHATLRLR